MAYLGGKGIGADHILNVLNDEVFDSFSYVEPFVGMGHVLRRVKKKRSHFASDGSGLLVSLLKHNQLDGKHKLVTKEEYGTLKEKYFSGKLEEEETILAAYAAYTHSFMGVMFGGYCPSSGSRNYVEERLRYYEKLKQNDKFMSCGLVHCDYRNIERHVSLDDKTLVYCDPPYANGERNSSTPRREEAFTYGDKLFDSSHFWSVVREWTKRGVCVLVSEYSAPDDFVVVSSGKKKQTIRRDVSKREKTENLYAHSSSWMATYFSKKESSLSIVLSPNHLHPPSPTFDGVVGVSPTKEPASLS